jgi:hypothetical protein
MPQSRPSQLRANKVYYEKNREQICENARMKYKEKAGRNQKETTRTIC